MNQQQRNQVVGGCALGLMFALASCGGGDSSGGTGGLCSLADAEQVSQAVGGIEVKAAENDPTLPGCRFTGPGATSMMTFDTVLDIALIEGDGAAKFGPTTDELSLGIVGSQLAENDQGWFSYSGVIGEQRLTVSSGQDRDDVYYDSPELRSLAEAALTEWVTANR